MPGSATDRHRRTKLRCVLPQWHALGRRRAEHNLHLGGVARDPRGRDRDRRYVVLLREAVDDGVQLGIVGRAEEDAREEARLWECARLDPRVMDELRAAVARAD